MEIYCKECGKELHGLKKMFCCKKCKDNYKNKHRTPEQKERYRIKNKETYKLKKEERLKQKAEYYQDNKDSIIKKNCQYKKEHPETDQKYSRSLKGRYRDYKRGAIKRGLDFSLTLDDFEKIWNSNCYYCGDSIDGIGIDRVDNNIGYITENIVSCCSACNVMKLTLRQKDFILSCLKIAKRFTI